MTIRWLFRLAFGCLAGLVIALGVLAALLFVSHRDLQESQRIRFESYLRADELRQSSDDLTRFARAYVVTGDPAFEDYYRQILAIRNGEQARPLHYERLYWDFVAARSEPHRKGATAVALQQLMLDLGFTPEEFAKLAEAQRNSDELVRTEEVAMHAMKGLFDDGTGALTRRGPPNQKMAVALMFGPQYYAAKAGIMRPIDEFFDMLDHRTAATSLGFANRSRLYLQLIMATLVLLLVITVGSSVAIHTKVAVPIATLQKQTEMVAADVDQLATVAHEISLGDRDCTFAISATPMGLQSTDEIGHLARLHDTMSSRLQVTGEAIARLTADLSDHAEKLEAANNELDRSNVLLQEHTVELHRTQEELRIAVESAESANQAKSEFLARMSHELRTPLNAILGYSEMLAEDAADLGNEAWVADLHKINKAGKHLLALVNDILDLAKVEAGKMDLHVERFDVDTALGDVVATVRPLIEQNSNQLVPRWSSDLGTMKADLTKVRQILFNLISNAAKFTTAGTVMLTVNRERRTDGEWLAFLVEDTGLGMTPQEMETIFQDFVQVDTSTTRRFGGTGLGLVVTQRFCEMMGGEITVESASGKGSQFTVHLPAEPRNDTPSIPPGVPERKVPSVPPRGEHGNPVRRALVIDDDAEARELVSRCLQHEGYGAMTAACGAEGLALARERHPSIIVLDIIMPGMDGWEVLRTLKEDPATADIPVIITSIMDQKRMGYALGVSGYLTKPIGCDRLSALLRRYRRSDPPAPLGRILVVDDDARSRDVISRVLARDGWTACQAENGSVALAQVREAVPTVILLDLMMPQMDGFEFVEELRRVDEWRRIPIVVVTAHNLDDEDRRRLSDSVLAVVEKGGAFGEGFLGELREQVALVTK